MQPNDDQTPDSNWSFQNEDEANTGREQAGSPAHKPSEPVTWTASEFISHHKNPAWYGVLVGGFIVLGTIIYAATKDIISVVAISLVFILFLVASGKKPQQRPYRVDDYGITIGDKFYPYDLFKSFNLSQEGAIGSISFMPLKRLMPEISIYYPPEEEMRIIDVLAANLPNEQRKEQTVDRLMKHLRF